MLLASKPHINEELHRYQTIT